MRSFYLVPPAPELPVWLFENHGPTRVFLSRLALAQWLGRRHLSDGSLAPALHSARLGSTVFGSTIVEHRWTARQGGDILNGPDLLALLPRPVRAHGHFIDKSCDHLIHRVSPVPRTGSSRGCYGHMLRSPRTLQLLREAFFNGGDEPAVRPRLRLRPTRWDDRIRSDAITRNWKHHRAHQWR